MTLFFYAGVFDLKVRHTHLNTKELCFNRSRYQVVIVIEQHNNGLLLYNRMKELLTVGIKADAVNERIHGRLRLLSA